MYSGECLDDDDNVIVTTFNDVDVVSNSRSNGSFNNNMVGISGHLVHSSYPPQQVVIAHPVKLGEPGDPPGPRGISWGRLTVCATGVAA